MYVLDEPSIGLHQRDNERLIGTLQHLRDLGNSVLVVEHDEDMIRAADHVVDMGPGAGVHGGRVIAQGTPRRGGGQPRLADRPLPGARAAHRRAARSAARWPTAPTRASLRIVGARGNNLQGRRRSRSRWACSPASPACRARARARWSTTRCTPRWRASSTRAMPSRRRTTRIEGLDALRQGHQRRPEPDRPHAAQQPGHLHRACSRRSASCSPRCRRRASAATAPGASASTWPAGAARPARATA